MPDSGHVEVADLNEFCEAVHARCVRAAQLLTRHSAECAHELHDRLTAGTQSHSAQVLAATWGTVLYPVLQLASSARAPLTRYALEIAL